MRDHSPKYDTLLQKARYPTKVPPSNLHSLELSSEPEWPLDTHLGVRYAQHRNQLWNMARFSIDPEPEVLEVLLEGGRKGKGNHPGVMLHQVEVTGPLTVGAALMEDRLRPHGVIAHGLLAGRSPSEVEFFFRSVYINTHPLAELLVDVPHPGSSLQVVTPSPISNPRPDRIREIAERCGWDYITMERLSPGRSGMMFRKRILTDSELIPVVTDLIANTERIHAIEKRLSYIEGGAEPSEERDRTPLQRTPVRAGSSLEAERKRADDAERELHRLQNRRSVKLALALSRPFRPVFRRVRSWKKRH